MEFRWGLQTLESEAQGLIVSYLKYAKTFFPTGLQLIPVIEPCWNHITWGLRSAGDTPFYLLLIIMISNVMFYACMDVCVEKWMNT